jgi:fimbrial chaperone protein
MKAARILILAFALGLPALGAGAFTLEPMSALLAPSGAGSVATFRVKNDGSERIAIRLSVLTRALDPEGKEQNEAVGALFVVYPSRLLIEPGATAVAKLQWKGPQRISEERPFRLVAEEVSVDPKPETSSGIKMRFRYIASLYVGLGGFEPKLEARVEGAEGPNGERGLAVEVRNSGTRHVVARNVQLTFTEADGPSAPLPADKTAALGGINYLPGSARKVFIPQEDAQVGKSYDAQLGYESEY